MKKLNAKRLAALAMTLVMLLGVLTACGDKADTNNGSGDGEGFPTMTIQIAHVNPTTDDDQYNKLATLFAEKVTAATDGAVTFEICGNSELGGEADVLTGFDLAPIRWASSPTAPTATCTGPLWWWSCPSSSRTTRLPGTSWMATS